MSRGGNPGTKAKGPNEATQILLSALDRLRRLYPEGPSNPEYVAEMRRAMSSVHSKLARLEGRPFCAVNPSHGKAHAKGLCAACYAAQIRRGTRHGESAGPQFAPCATPGCPNRTAIGHGGYCVECTRRMEMATEGGRTEEDSWMDDPPDEGDRILVTPGCVLPKFRYLYGVVRRVEDEGACLLVEFDGETSEPGKDASRFKGDRAHIPTKYALPVAREEGDPVPEPEPPSEEEEDEEEAWILSDEEDGEEGGPTGSSWPAV